MSKAVNIDALPAGAETDQYGFPVRSLTQAAEPLPGASLAEMTNDYQHVKGKFWMRAPKLKQQKALAKIQGRIQGIADPVGIMDVFTELCGLFLFVEDGEDYRLALADEIDEHFDLAEVQSIVTQMTGMKLQGEGDAPKN